MHTLYLSLCLSLTYFLSLSLSHTHTHTHPHTQAKLFCRPSDQICSRFSVSHFLIQNCVSNFRFKLSFFTIEPQPARIILKHHLPTKNFVTMANPGPFSFIFFLLLSQFKYKLKNTDFSALESNLGPQDGRILVLGWHLYIMIVWTQDLGCIQCIIVWAFSTTKISSVALKNCQSLLKLLHKN